MADAPTTKRAQARVAMTADIKRIAREHLGEHGADGLSLRAVARELGVVSSAVYRSGTIIVQPIVSAMSVVATEPPTWYIGCVLYMTSSGVRPIRRPSS